jgi:glycosyltransferase involved in cell wall biosynthesis
VLGRGVAVSDEIQAAGAGMAVAPEADAVAAAVCAFVADDGLRARAGQAARVLASERYSPDAMADRLCALYAELAGVRGKETRS